MSDSALPAANGARTPSPISPVQRLVNVLNLGALTLALAFLLVLNFVAAVPVLRDSLGPLVLEHQVASLTAAILTLVVAVGLPLGSLIYGRRKGWLRWPQFAALWSLVIATGVYLSWDEPTVTRPLTMDELSPPLPGDQATFQMVMRYAKNTPTANAVTAPKSGVPAATSDIARAPDKWAQFLKTNRAAIEADWEKLAPVRAWWDELATQPRLGDLTVPHPSAPIMAFQPVRAYSQLASAMASLQALDGKGDEAMATVTKLYSVARKLEPSSRTLVRTMIAKVMQRMAMNTATFVLDRSTVSPAARAAFVAELTAATNGPAGARRLILIEYTFFQPYLSLFIEGAPVTEEKEERVLQKFLRLNGHLVINPNATQNLVGDRYYQLAALAEQRRMGELEVNKAAFNTDFTTGYHVKNIGGRLFASMTMPALSKVTQSYWEIDDLRLTLLKRLKS